jgi:hypothetical protein
MTLSSSGLEKDVSPARNSARLENLLDFRRRLSPDQVGDFWWSFGDGAQQPFRVFLILIATYEQNGIPFVAKLGEFLGSYTEITVNDLHQVDSELLPRRAYPAIGPREHGLGVVVKSSTVRPATPCHRRPAEMPAMLRPSPGIRDRRSYAPPAVIFAMSPAQCALRTPEPTSLPYYPARQGGVTAGNRPEKQSIGIIGKLRWSQACG